MSAKGLRSIEIVSRDVIGRFVPEAYRRIGVSLHLDRAMPDFALTLMHLVNQVEVQDVRRIPNEDSTE